MGRKKEKERNLQGDCHIQADQSGYFTLSEQQLKASFLSSVVFFCSSSHANMPFSSDKTATNAASMLFSLAVAIIYNFTVASSSSSTCFSCVVDCGSSIPRPSVNVSFNRNGQDDDEDLKMTVFQLHCKVTQLLLYMQTVVSQNP